MSTFGKKALIWWDYYVNNKDSSIRYARTPKEMQLKILNKWYPIGMKCLLNWRYGDGEIVDYTETIGFWALVMKIDGENHMSNPLVINPTPESKKEIKREIKLKRILGHAD